jgi:hypothetical protein
MNVDYLIQYIAMFTTIILFLSKAKGMRKYIPAGLFSVVYANIWCYAAEYLKIWNYPSRIIYITVVNIPFNYVVLPILVMFWLRYMPVNSAYRIAWGIGWSLALSIIELIITRFTNILKYTNGFDVHISFILWLISFYIFFKFHCWITYTKYLED